MVDGAGRRPRRPQDPLTPSESKRASQGIRELLRNRDTREPRTGDIWLTLPIPAYTQLFLAASTGTGAKPIAAGDFVVDDPDDPRLEKHDGEHPTSPWLKVYLDAGGKFVKVGARPGVVFRGVELAPDRLLVVPGFSRQPRNPRPCQHIRYESEAERTLGKRDVYYAYDNIRGVHRRDLLRHKLSIDEGRDQAPGPGSLPPTKRAASFLREVLGVPVESRRWLTANTDELQKKSKDMRPRRGDLVLIRLKPDRWEPGLVVSANALHAVDHPHRIIVARALWLDDDLRASPGAATRGPGDHLLVELPTRVAQAVRSAQAKRQPTAKPRRRDAAAFPAQFQKRRVLAVALTHLLGARAGRGRVEPVLDADELPIDRGDFEREWRSIEAKLHQLCEDVAERPAPAIPVQVNEADRARVERLDRLGRRADREASPLLALEAAEDELRQNGAISPDEGLEWKHDERGRVVVAICRPEPVVYPSTKPPPTFGIGKRPPGSAPGLAVGLTGALLVGVVAGGAASLASRPFSSQRNHSQRGPMRRIDAASVDRVRGGGRPEDFPHDGGRNTESQQPQAGPAPETTLGGASGQPADDTVIFSEDFETIAWDQRGPGTLSDGIAVWDIGGPSLRTRTLSGASGQGFGWYGGGVGAVPSSATMTLPPILDAARTARVTFDGYSAVGSDITILVARSGCDAQSATISSGGWAPHSISLPACGMSSRIVFQVGNVYAYTTSSQALKVDNIRVEYQ